MTFLENIDKAKLQKILLITISALLLIALTILLVIIVMSINPTGLSTSKLEYVNTEVDEQTLKTGSLLLADAKHPYKVDDETWLDLVDGCTAYMLSQSDIDPDSKDIVDAKDYDKYSKLNYVPWQNMRLNKTAMAATHKMLTAAKSSVKQNPVTIDAAYDVVKFGSSYEYATALAILLSDFESTGEERVPLSAEYKSWFEKNAATYGFIAMDVEDGYRYVGVPHAKYIKDNSLTLTEYITYLKENTNTSKLLSLTVDGTDYAVYYIPCQAGDTVKVPASADYTISGTNEGGVIVTVTLKK